MTCAIDWEAPLRFKTVDHVENPQLHVRTDSGNAVIRYTLLDTDKEFYRLVDRYGSDKESGGFDIENYAPEPEVSESPKNCLLLIRCDDGEWFFHCGHTPEHGREDFALPKTREEVEDWAADFGYDCLIVEVPERK